ncbi:molybdate transport repressor ModE-like protein [Variovorax sp. TBS-050B]|uniref:LysR substrate-binding domain-containing protein n=1 Tax=Variovorax sp. TBS-050B TaxID=2940551 RepID=UPI002475BBA1|nr:LysR substrate-binding domain-containing protein [Variovorax sp. TBS-050B]MDH6593846.1 molybdate transport repressor ModE-like protein [Variovorax sp. TBS-050B]
MSALDLDQLRTLVAIEECGSFAAAAAKLDLTQSAVTQQMQRLERRIGHALFEKAGRGRRPSGHALRLLVYARRLLAVHDEALRGMADAGEQGRVRIGAAHDMADLLLPRVLAQIAQTMPRMQIDIEISRSPHLMTALAQGRLDIVIANRVDPEAEGALLRMHPTVWLCAAGYQHDPSKPVPLIVIDGPSLFHRLAVEALQGAGLGWTASYTTSNVLGVKAALRAGLGVAARGIEFVDSYTRVLGAREGLPPLPDVPYFLYVRRHVVNPLTRRVFEMLRDDLGLVVS